MSELSRADVTASNAAAIVVVGVDLELTLGPELDFDLGSWSVEEKGCAKGSEMSGMAVGMVEYRDRKYGVLEAINRSGHGNGKVDDGG
jgi:hypothetical protein